MVEAGLTEKTGSLHLGSSVRAVPGSEVAHCRVAAEAADGGQRTSDNFGRTRVDADGPAAFCATPSAETEFASFDTVVGTGLLPRWQDADPSFSRPRSYRSERLGTTTTATGSI
jgi:hypothetical protein